MNKRITFEELNNLPAGEYTNIWHNNRVQCDLPSQFSPEDIEIQNWLETNCNNRYYLRIIIAKGLSDKPILVSFEDRNDQQAFIKQFSNIIKQAW